MIFPLAYLLLTSSATMLVIVLGLGGRAELAAELAVVQGALLATFYAFSASTRTLILQGHSELTPERLLAIRLVALPVLCVAAYFLSVTAAGISSVVALLLILRRACEWIAEIRLSEVELTNHPHIAKRVLYVQAALTALTALVFIFTPAWSMTALAVYAVSPLIGAWPRASIASFRLASLIRTFRIASPYIGSTAVEGVGNYVFRLMVFLLTGPSFSGTLFTAFILGGFAATLFANAIGPSLGRRRSRAPALLTAGTAVLAAAGLLVSVLSIATHLADWLARPGYFWLATGLSMVGGAVMIVAQWIRVRLFDLQHGDVLFGPDVIRNVAAILAAPVLSYITPLAITGLYLVMAIVTFVLYWGAMRSALRPRSHTRAIWLQVSIAAMVLAPVFVLLSGHVYRAPGGPLLDTGGSVLNVPLPISLGVCVAAIFLLGRYRDALTTINIIFFLFAGMVFTTVVTTEGQLTGELRKFVLLFQFLLPATALVLGQMYGAEENSLKYAAAGFLLIILFLPPLQLLLSMGDPNKLLTHDLIVFSVYQHLQYVPAVIVTAYLIALFALWDSPRARVPLTIASVVVGAYAALSYSTVAIVLAVMGALAFLARNQARAALVCTILLIAAVTAVLYMNRDALPLKQRFERSQSATQHRLEQAPTTEVPKSLLDAVPGPLQPRLHYWHLYARGILQSGRGLLFGHSAPMDRALATSAHNYYLDFVYNFGLVAFAPLGWLVWYTVSQMWKLRSRLWARPSGIGLAIAFLFVCLIDNMVKVPLRQPYPGVFFFFVWGLLLAWMSEVARNDVPRT